MEVMTRLFALLVLLAVVTALIAPDVALACPA
jgi:hypothetical protein